MRRKQLSFVSKGGPYQSVVLWKRGGGASEVFNEIFAKADDSFREDLVKAIPRIDSDIDEVVAKIPARYFDETVTIQKSFKPKGNKKMDTGIDIDEAKIAEGHIQQISGRYRRLQSLLKSEEDPVAKAGREGAALADLIIKSQAARLRKADPSLTEAQAYERAYMAPENAALRRAENTRAMLQSSAVTGLTSRCIRLRRAATIFMRAPRKFKSATASALRRLSTKPRCLQ